MPDQPVQWSRFHHPGFSLTVVRRRVAAELLDMLAAYGVACITRGRSPVDDPVEQSSLAERMALWRLERAGLLVRIPVHAGPPVIQLTDRWTPRDVSRPERFWDQPWKGIWFVLAYDIPESERATRTVLRRFLRRLRMGCLQRSVWVSARDIRPEYSDLADTTHLDLQACLFESRTTLGRTDADIVRAAWDWDALRTRHAWYIENARSSLDALVRRRPTKAEALALTREEMAAYLTVMEADPLLPRPLWPEEYQGEVAVTTHRLFVASLRPRLAGI